MQIEFEGKKYYINQASNGKSYVELDYPHNFDMNKTYDEYPPEMQEKFLRYVPVSYGKVFDIFEKGTCEFDLARKSVGERQRIYFDVKRIKKEGMN